MSNFVQPETIKIPLSNPGDWIEIKKKLNVGEQKRVEAAGVRRSPLMPPTIDWPEYKLGRVAVWVTGWGGPGFMDAEGVFKVYSPDAIKALDPDVFEEIENLISEHVKELDAAKKASPSVTTG